MVPGQSTGWHRHDLPLHARILPSSIRGDDGDGVTRTYRAGDTFMESMGHGHDGHVVGDSEEKLLIVLMGRPACPTPKSNPKPHGP